MAEHVRVTEYALPGVLQTIALLTTVDIAIALAREWGGRRRYVPRDLRAGHPLAKIVGRQAALRICQELGGRQVEVPAARTYLRWYDARQLKSQGKSEDEIAQALDVTGRQVRALLKGFDPGATAAPGSCRGPSNVCPVCHHRRREAREPHHDPRQLVLF